MKPLIVSIVGPTGVGKSKVAVELALRLNGEIISADSMQIYRGLDIGTAKISIDETKGIPHHLIDVVKPDEPFSVADFQKLAKVKIADLIAKGKTPMLVGGTGLYINSIIAPYTFQEHPADISKRNELSKLAEIKGNQFVHGLLEKVDLDLANKLHPNDIRRVIRGIEYYEATGQKISSNYNKKNKFDEDFNLALIGLTMERKILYQQIERRVDKMIKEGLVDEVRQILKKGYCSNIVSLQGLGYKEIIGYLQGEYDFNEAIRLLKRNTRRFAKRQLTWFKRDSRIKWFDIGAENFLNITMEIYEYIGRTTKIQVE